MSLFWDDFFSKHLIKTMFASAEDKPALVEALFATHVPAFFNAFAKKLSGKKFIVEDTVKHVDFVVGGFFLNMVLNPLNPMHD